MDDPSLRQKLLKRFNFKYITSSYQTGRLAVSLGKHLLKTTKAHAGILIVISFVLLGNVSGVGAQVTDENSTATLAGFTPEAIGDVVQSIAPFTPELEEKPVEVVTAMAANADTEYLATNDTFDTTLTPDITPPVAAEKTDDEPRTRTITYTVQPKDTLSTISDKFNLKLATLQYTNNITNIHSLKPGQVLKIPVNDLSDVAIAKAKQATDKAKTRTVAYSRQTIARNGTYPSSDSNYIVPISHNGISRGIGRGHTGIDYRANIGTAVRAAADGRIIEADGFGWNSGWGKTIVVDHGQGRTTRYAHLSTINVDNGEWVSQGQIIAASGNTGRSTGPHLHFEARVYGRVVQPF